MNKTIVKLREPLMDRIRNRFNAAGGLWNFLLGRFPAYGGMSPEKCEERLREVITKLAPCNTDDVIRQIPGLSPRIFDAFIKRFQQSGQVVITLRVIETHPGTIEYPEISLPGKRNTNSPIQVFRFG